MGDGSETALAPTGSSTRGLVRRAREWSSWGFAAFAGVSTLAGIVGWATVGVGALFGALGVTTLTTGLLAWRSKRKIAATRKHWKGRLREQKKALRKNFKEIMTRRQQEAERKAVEAMHFRWFPDQQAPDHLDLDYSVSFFRPHPNPVRPESWKCVVRSGDKKRGNGREPKLWPHTREKEKLRRAGAVVFTAVHPSKPIDVDGLPDAQGRSDEDIDQYLKDTKLSPEEHNDRSWHFPSILTCAAEMSTLNVGLVMVIERKSGLPIEPARGKKDCLTEMRLVAEIWMNAWEDELK